MKAKKKKASAVMVLHYIRLAYRSVLFLLLLAGYINYRIRSGKNLTVSLEERPAIVMITWAVFALEMLLRFFPSRFESPGCQKQFKSNYIKSGNTQIAIPDNNGTMMVALIWIVFNGIFGALHMAGILDDGIMILLCACYSVCDMICILFFCPFQSWLLKNKCCSACRIYNWDYAMMFTPLFFVRWSIPGACSPFPSGFFCAGRSRSTGIRSVFQRRPTNICAVKTALKNSARTKNSWGHSGSISKSIRQRKSQN